MKIPITDPVAFFKATLLLNEASTRPEVEEALTECLFHVKNHDQFRFLLGRLQNPHVPSRFPFHTVPSLAAAVRFAIACSLMRRVTEAFKAGTKKRCDWKFWRSIHNDALYGSTMALLAERCWGICRKKRKRLPAVIAEVQDERDPAMQLRCIFDVVGGHNRFSET